MTPLSFGLLLTVGVAGADPAAPVVPLSTPTPYTLADAVAPGLPPVATGPATQAMPATPGYAPAALPQAAAPAPVEKTLCDVCNAPARGLFQSDRGFEGFVGPITNPVFSKDPRSNTYARFLFINNRFPSSHPFGGGNAQVYAMQLNLALTERLSFIADKDGLGHLNVPAVNDRTGFLNVAAGFKYTFYRNVETQTIAAAGFMYEVPSGEAKIFQGHGGGALAPFVTFGKEFQGKWHYLQTSGLYVPLEKANGNKFFYNSFHVDRQVLGWLYPLAELNWYWYNGGGNRLPGAVGEGDGLLNLGSRGINTHQVTGAVGLKAVLGRHVTAGIAYEFPLTSPQYLINDRLTVELILRY